VAGAGFLSLGAALFACAAITGLDKLNEVVCADDCDGGPDAFASDAVSDQGDAGGAETSYCDAQCTSIGCAAGGCNAPGGACTDAGQTCHCTSDTQCASRKCVATPGQNDISCAGNCSGTGPADGFDCELAAPGIPATPTPATTTFGYLPSNFSPSAFHPPAADTTDCNATYDSTRHAIIAGACAAAPAIYASPAAANAGGPTVDVLVFANLTIAPSSTLHLQGKNPVILVAFGSVAIEGTIDARGTATAPGAGGDSAAFCGAGVSSTSNDQCGGGGGGRIVPGGTGIGSGGCSPAPGVAPPPNNANGIPLVAGCPGAGGGNSGGTCGVTPFGHGGGAVQISAAGAISVSGSIFTNGGNGTTATVTVPWNNGTWYGCGGGGGGSAGDIVLEGNPVSVTGKVTANGGAGGGGDACGCTTAAGGAGGAGAVNDVATTTAPGNGTKGTCSSATMCTVASGNGGGGGGYGAVQINSASGGAQSYACATSLTPAPTPNAAHNLCLCVADSNCSSGKCSNASGQCTGTCTGSTAPGTFDSQDCQRAVSTPCGCAM
jgi:hypothetical protein